MKTPTRQRQILVVDDGRAYVRLLLELRARAEYDASAAQTAQDDIGVVVDSPHDLALVDVRRPGGFGLIIRAAPHSPFDVHFVIFSRIEPSNAPQQIRAARVAAGVMAERARLSREQAFAATAYVHTSDHGRLRCA